MRWVFLSGHMKSTISLSHIHIQPCIQLYESLVSQRFFSTEMPTDFLRSCTLGTYEYCTNSTNTHASLSQRLFLDSFSITESPFSFVPPRISNILIFHFDSWVKQWGFFPWRKSFSFSTCFTVHTGTVATHTWDLWPYRYVLYVLLRFRWHPIGSRIRHQEENTTPKSRQINRFVFENLSLHNEIEDWREENSSFFYCNKTCSN